MKKRIWCMLLFALCLVLFPIPMQAWAAGTDTGLHTYCVCNGCQKYFADEEGKNEITKEDTVIALLLPAIITGGDLQWTKGSKEGLAVKSSGSPEGGVTVLVDGKELGSEHYQSEGDDITVTITADYLETLSEGTHRLTIRSAGGDADADFTVNAPDHTLTIVIVSVICVLSLVSAGLVYVFIIRKRKNR